MNGQQFIELVNLGNDIEKKMLRIMEDEFCCQDDYELSGYEIQDIKKFAHYALQYMMEREVN